MKTSLKIALIAIFTIAWLLPKFSNAECSSGTIYVYGNFKVIDPLYSLGDTYDVSIKIINDCPDNTDWLPWGPLSPSLLNTSVPINGFTHTMLVPQESESYYYWQVWIGVVKKHNGSVVGGGQGWSYAGRDNNNFITPYDDPIEVRIK